MAAYYNENDPFVVAWLRELIKAGLIADGEVDDRSIELVRPDDLRGFIQCHFFAGIGGWSYALRLAGWPDDRAVWTGSCPCQPWSMANQRSEATNDRRDLWPAWFRLIDVCCPRVVFGEQTAGRVGLAWMDRVSVHLEGIDYAVGAACLSASGSCAPHQRQRLWFVADAGHERRRTSQSGLNPKTSTCREENDSSASGVGDMADTEGVRCGQRDSVSPRLTKGARAQGSRRGSTNIGWFGFWHDHDWVVCGDGQSRPIEPGSCPVAHGVSARVGRLRGYGNAIVPQVAQVFIQAYLDCDR